MLIFQTVDGGIEPEKKTKGSAGYDVCLNEDVNLSPGDSGLFSLGIMFIDSYPHEGEYYLELHLRSSMRIQGLYSGVGIIDADYRDVIKIYLQNNSKAWFSLKKGERIAQLIPKRLEEGIMGGSIVESEANRDGGFGSTNGETEIDMRTRNENVYIPQKKGTVRACDNCRIHTVVNKHGLCRSCEDILK